MFSPDTGNGDYETPTSSAYKNQTLMRKSFIASMMRDNSVDKAQIPPFNNYVLMSPTKKIQKSKSIGYKGYNTIESNFRSAEKVKAKKLLPIDSNEDYCILQTIEKLNNNVNIKKPMMPTKKLSIREMDTHMKKAVQKHKNSLTFGLPSTYSKVKSNIDNLIRRIDTTEDERDMGYSNEKQKRQYKNQLLQESFQNKMGLVNKPTTSQLMIGDFVREKRQRSLAYGGVGKRNKLKANISDSSLIYQRQEEILKDEEKIDLKRRFTSKSHKKNQNNCGFDVVNRQNYSVNKPILRCGAKNKSKRRGKISKIHLRNPSSIKGNESLSDVL